MTNPSTGIVLEGPIAELREREIRLLHDMAAQVATWGPEGEADRHRLIQAADDLREMFLMVVVIGEFNAGKSTFINALIGDNVLTMGITPTTDMIELIRYTPTEKKPHIRDESIREWGHPSMGLPGVVIVDTPGTGSVFQKHEQIAKSFLHRSDLVIFVISAKRAFADTERLYLELAKNYGKKIIIVVNQVDLLDAKEQNEVRNFVMRQVDELLSIRPPIFMVSARKALQGERATGLLATIAGTGKDEWGMNAVRAYLRETFEQVPPAKQKLITHLELGKRITEKYVAEAQKKITLVGADTNAAEDLQREIEHQATNLDTQLNSTLNEIQRIFEGVQQRGEAFIERQFKVWQAVRRGVDKEAMRQEFERDVMGDALTRLTATQEQYANALVDSGRAYWRGVMERLNRMDALLNEEAGSMDASSYADQRAALQEALSAADLEMKGYTIQKVLTNLQTDFDQDVQTFLYGATSGILGFVTALVALLTPGALVAHPLALLGFAVGAPVALLGGGAALIAYRRAVGNARKKLQTQIRDLESNYRNAIINLTASERGRLTQYGKQVLSPVFGQLQVLAQRYKEQQQLLGTFKAKAEEMEREIDRILIAVKPIFKN